MSSYSTTKIVRATTASAMTVEQWEHVWTLAAPVIVAAGRFLDVEQEANPKLTLDAHFQLLRAVTEYRHGAASCVEESPHDRTRDRSLGEFADLCECGHTAYWHAHDGKGDCEGSNFAAPGSFVPCECARFTQVLKRATS